MMKSITARILRQRPELIDDDFRRTMHQLAEDEVDELGRRMREGVIPVRPRAALREIDEVLGSQRFFRSAL